MHMKALFTSFHMLYCLSQYSEYSLRYGRMTIAEWELSLANHPFVHMSAHLLDNISGTQTS